MGAEGSGFKSRCPDNSMTLPSLLLPPGTFWHTPGKGYSVHRAAAEQTVLSPVWETEEAFSSLVLSVQYTSGGSGFLLTEVQLRQDGVWSPFFKLAFYSQKLNHSFGPQENEFGVLQVDELQAKHPAQAYRFRLTLQGETEVTGVAVCVAGKHPSAAAAHVPAGQRQVTVMPLSQMQLAVAPAEQKRLCSPTSLCMALQALGVAADPLETARVVHDAQADIFGNWTLNTAYAARRGLWACVTRFQALAQLEPFVSERSLVLASIAYGPGELSGSATEQTPGHLVLVCGWSGSQIRVADPAARTAAEVIRFYDAAEFARAWLQRKGGAAYLVRRK